jgi:ABC-type dipeptide/oligopeptide/nickel transport system permease subunit
MIRVEPVPIGPAVQQSAGGRLATVVRDLRRHRNIPIGGALLMALTLTAMLAPALVPYPPTLPAPGEALQAPSARHWMGTDEIGRDIFSRTLTGARISLPVGLAASLISLVLGVMLGLPAGYRGGWLGTILMRTVDVLMALPTLLLGLAMVAALGPSLVHVTLAIGIAGAPRFARLVQSCVLTARASAYVEAARVVGCDDRTIAVRHILPNIIGPALVMATLNVGSAILAAATLSFLGMGAQPPTPEWGLILARGRDFLGTAWWISTFPGLAIMFTVLAVNMLGDGLRDALDPRLRI